MLKYLIIPFFLLALGCANTSSAHRNWIVLDYGDFGPQVIAHEIAGMEWWQWQDHGDPSPIGYAIKVVVYKDTSEAMVKREFPVDPGKQMDYRYLEYLRALEYLDEKINDDVVESVTDTLKSTRETITRHFN